MANLDPHVVGRRLRGLRTRRDLTLADVAAETDISVSTLSAWSQAVAARHRAARAPRHTYRVTLDELVDAPATGDPRVHAKPIQAWGAMIIPLTARRGGQRAFKHVLYPEARSVPTRAPRGLRLSLRAVRQVAVLGEHDIVMGPGRSPSSTPAPRTGSAARTGSRWSSRSSGPRASACTYAPAKLQAGILTPSRRLYSSRRCRRTAPVTRTRSVGDGPMSNPRRPPET